MKEKAWLFNRNADLQRTDKDILLLECVHSLFFLPLKNSVRKQGHISIINGIGKEGKGLEWFIFDFIFSEKMQIPFFPILFLIFGVVLAGV